MKDFNKEEKYIGAKKRVDDIKAFYTHLVVYVLVNIFISSIKIAFNIRGGESFSEAFFDFSTFAVWMAWGIGITFHGFAVYSENTPSFRRWKEKKLQEFLEEETANFKTTNNQLGLEHYEGDFSKREAYFHSKKKVENLMGFCWHAVVYIVVNVFILSVLYFVTNISFTAWYTYATAFFWGIGLGFHAIVIFGRNVVFGKGWEQRKIKEFMRKEEQTDLWN
ncbi:2TM domain-containing protein [Seonamhaeicola sp.]|uniref:2TM domain-containing protein n=1 Tax=Seonamhaeicola sp. TaxID=1912245 RepID=UPI00260695FD|nr:2TM domain-containing protein [Seonamhaeicola sp.]